MKKKLLLTISMALFLVCIFVISVSAATEIDGLYYSLSGSGENAVAELTSDNVKCTIENVVIPESVTYDGVTYRVTAIQVNGFSGSNPQWAGNKVIKSVVIPASVKSIGSHAFRNCTALESLTVYAKNENGIALSDAEFYNCTSLKEVDMSMSDITVFGQYCFNGDKSLVTFKYPPKLKSIGAQCFRSCKALTSGDFSGTQLEQIYSWGLGECTSIKELKLPTTMKGIHSNALQNSTIEKLILPHGFNTLGNDSLPFLRSLYLLVLPEISTDNTTIHPEALHDTNPKVVIYSGNTYEHLTSSGKIFASYTVKPFSEYDPTATYTQKTFFYGATTCDRCNGLLGEEGFAFVDLLTEMKIQTACTNCDYSNVKTSYKAVFESLGYSKNLSSGAIVQGFKINKSSVSALGENGYSLSAFGVLATSVSNLNGSNTAFDESNAPKNGVIVADGSGFLYDIFEIKIRNIPLNETAPDGTSYADTQLYICAYAVLDGVVYYISNGEISTELLPSVSYNSIK